jgi:hypothetical protein
MIKSRRVGWVGNVERIKENRNADRLLVGKREGKRLLGRPRRREVNTIKMDLGETGWGALNSIYLAQDKDKLRALLIIIIIIVVINNIYM